MTVEVFKTNVSCPEVANEVLITLLGYFPNAQINFDLDDCDKILRIKSSNICINTVIDTLISLGYNCEVLE